MNTNKRKSSKSAAPVNTYAAAVATCTAVFTGIISGIRSAAAESESRSMQAVGAIKALAATLNSDDYNKAVVELFGNGEKGKAHVAGSLAATLKDDKSASAVTIRNFLAHCRVVASSWNRQDVRDAAEKSGIRKARDVAKPKAASDPAPAAKAPTLSELIAEKIKADGVVSVLAIVESACKATAKVIEGDRVHATIVALSAK